MRSGLPHGCEHPTWPQLVTLVVVSLKPQACDWYHCRIRSVTNFSVEYAGCPNIQLPREKPINRMLVYRPCSLSSVGHCATARHEP
jgi:hypothetical protein